ncbi:MAG: hypothetical protein ABUT39_25470 [Acidobacteriota bacterium]
MALTGQFTDIPSGTLVPQLSGKKLSVPFVMKAQLKNDGGSCAAGEYRQYVKGYFTVDGNTITHVLCGSVTLSPDEFRIDGCGPGKGCTAYGYRACPASSLDQYLPAQDTGCTYEGSDEPGLSGSSGQTLEINLDFHGELINTSTSEVLATADWKVKGSATIPKDVTTYRFSSFAAAGRPLVRIARHDGDWLVSLHYAGAPGGKAATLDISVLDEKGEALVLEPYDSVEVGGSKATTRVLRLKVKGDGGRPVRVRVKGDDEAPLDLPIVE